MERMFPYNRAMYDFGASQIMHRNSSYLIHTMDTFRRELAHAAEFYQSFKEQFDQEISGLTYLSKRHLNDIWTERVTEKSPGSGNNTSETPAPKFWEKFGETNRSLIRSAYEAYYAIGLARNRAGGFSSYAQTDPAKHFQEKLHLALEQTKELMEAAALSPDACENLIRELNSQKALVSPDSERLKELYRSKNLEEGAWGWM